MKKAKKRKNIVLRIVLSVLGILILAGVTVVFLFRARNFEVEGNDYYGDTTITTWIQNDRLSVNSLYILLKYDFLDPELPSGVEDIKVSLKNPWTVRVTVKEKELAGYVDYDDAYLYFDGEGIASIRTTQQIEGVPYIEGLSFDTNSVELGKAMPVEDDSIFDRIVEASRYLNAYGLKPDRMSCENDSVQVYFGSVKVLLGNTDYEERVAQIEPILESLLKQYPDAAGTLHLENYDSSASSVRFVRDEE